MAHLVCPEAVTGEARPASPCGPNQICTVASITSNELTTGGGSGNTSPDSEITGAVERQPPGRVIAHHRSIATSAASSASVPRSENRMASPTRIEPPRMDSRSAGDAAPKLVVLAGSSPRISSCVMTSSCG